MHIAKQLVAYVAVLAVVLVGLGLGLSRAVEKASEFSQRPQQKQTLLDRRIESSREIRAALSKPLPAPEPLQPITAKLAHPAASRVASREPAKSRLKRARLPAALNAMAMGNSMDPPWQALSYAPSAFDRSTQPF
jgi:hypothetical protein